MLELSPNDPIVRAYLTDLKHLKDQQVTHELGLKGPFQNLLDKAAKKRGWTLVPEPWNSIVVEQVGTGGQAEPLPASLPTPPSSPAPRGFCADGQPARATQETTMLETTANRTAEPSSRDMPAGGARSAARPPVSTDTCKRSHGKGFSRVAIGNTGSRRVARILPSDPGML